MGKTIFRRIKGLLDDFFLLASNKGISPFKTFDREFCVSLRQFEHLPFNNIKILVDVGAHEGLFSKRASKVFNLSKIVMVEPLADKAIYLKNLNLPGAIICNAALSDIEGISNFNINECLQASSLLEINSSVVSNYNIDNLKVSSSVEVNVRRLDNLMGDLQIERIDLLKLDTQGAELNILKGLGEKIKYVRLIQIELLFEEHYIGTALFFEINDFLYSNGFVLNRLFDFDRGKDGRILHCDGWYINTKFQIK